MLALCQITATNQKLTREPIQVKTNNSRGGNESVRGADGDYLSSGFTF